jgi:CHAT domain-containing protein
LWWCPVGILAYLPLHAAGHHEDILDGTPNPRTVLDRVVSSYTATIQSLAYARQAPPDTGAVAPVLIVSVPAAPGTATLDNVSDETRRLARILPGARVIEGADAGSDNVLTALTTHPVVHFACHGLSDWDDPGNSRLVLHDHLAKPLTIAAISQLRLDGAELAYLSACSTAEAQPRLADEAVHITASFQLAGYRHVIGTLWPVNDQAATDIATDLYSRLTSGDGNRLDTRGAALALHHAVRRLRSGDGRHLAPPTLWAAYIHTGI